MEDDTNEEFYDASDIFVNEYFDTETKNSQQKISVRNCEISSVFHETDTNLDSKTTKDVFLEAILNEESLKRIYFEERCISNNFTDLNGEEEIREKINLWSYINNESIPRNNVIKKEGDENITIEEEVKELELEIEQMFNTNPHEFKAPEVVSIQEQSSGEDTNISFFSPVQSKRKISYLPLPSNEIICNRTMQIECIPKVDCCSKNSHVETQEHTKKNLIRIPSTTSMSSIDTDCSFDKEFSSDSEEIFTLLKKDSSKIRPVQSIEVLPKPSKKPIKSKLKKLSIVRNLIKADTLLESANFHETEEIKIKNNNEEKLVKNVQPEFRKVQSLIVKTESVKKEAKNTSRSFNSERTTKQKILASDPSNSRDNIKGPVRTRTPLKKLKLNDSKKLKTEKLTVKRSKMNNRAINTARIMRKNFCCQKIGAFINSTNFCSISLTLDSARTSVDKEELMTSMKEYYWVTESNKEKALLQLVILCMENNFQEIQIVHEKFSLYCQNEFSTCSIEKTNEDCKNDIEDSFKSDIISQPLYIETIRSQSDVNRLALESKFEDSCTNDNKHVVNRTITQIEELEQNEDEES